jgi:hypothetical protein
VNRRTFLKGTAGLGALVPLSQLTTTPNAEAKGMSTFQLWFQWQDPNADALNNPTQFQAHASQYASAFKNLNSAIAAGGRNVSAPIVNGGCQVGQIMQAGSFWLASMFGDDPGTATMPWDTSPELDGVPNLWGKMMEDQNTCGVTPGSTDLSKLNTGSVFGLVMQMALETIPSIAGMSAFNGTTPNVLVNTNIGTGVTGFNTNIAETKPPTGVSGVTDPGKPFQVWAQWRTYNLVNGVKVGNAAQTWVDNMNALVNGLTNHGMYIAAAGCSPVFNYGQEDNFQPTVQQKAPNPLNNNEIDPFLFWMMSIFGFDGVPSGQSSESLWDGICTAGTNAGTVGYFQNLLTGSGPLSPLLNSGEQSTYAKGVDQSSIAITVNVSNEDGNEPVAELFLPTA